MQNYSNIQRFLHDFVLSRKIVNKSLFEIEKIFFLKNKDIKNQSHVFITGLPRSGTTSLLNFLFSSNEYASLTYNNMPFILSPHLSKLFYKKNVSKKERLHKDGIDFDNSSPEALDEIFFDNNEEFVKHEIVNYIQLILLSNNKTKYLSKNNLNYKRIDMIKSIFPNSIFLIPIREPLQHSNSLLNQHLLFSQLQKEDDFIRRYMNYLGHNEFGLNHKSWNKSIHFHDLNNINYWLEQYFLFYENILNRYKINKNFFFVIYDELSNKHYLDNLIDKIDLNKDNVLPSSYFKKSIKKLDTNFDKELHSQCNNLFIKIKKCN